MRVPGWLRMWLRRLPFYAEVRRRRHEKELENWVRAGKPAPLPHFAKVSELRDYAHRFRTPVLVETGTYLGDTVHAVKDLFERIYSIELDPALHRNARKRFVRDRNITLLEGDSGVVIRQVLAEVDRPCLFWLDGHYSGDFTAKGEIDSPISAELCYISEHPRKREHVILIDDAHEFNGTSGYPTIETLREWAASEGYDRFEIKDNIIRIHNADP